MAWLAQIQHLQMFAEPEASTATFHALTREWFIDFEPTQRQMFQQKLMLKFCIAEELGKNLLNYIIIKAEY